MRELAVFIALQFSYILFGTFIYSVLNYPGSHRVWYMWRSIFFGVAHGSSH